jgi:hypothetical protein
MDFLTVSRLRRDGFCALETFSDKGRLTLRPLISGGGDIRINAIVGDVGSIRAELRTVPGDQPIPGYGMEDSIPVRGDGHFLKLAWKDRDTIDRFKGLPFRIRFEMKQARLYAVRVDATYLFGYIPTEDLAGSYVPHQLPEFERNQDYGGES